MPRISCCLDGPQPRIFPLGLFDTVLFPEVMNVSSITPAPIPEIRSLVLLGLAALGSLRRKR